MSKLIEVTDELLDRLERLDRAGTPGDWKAMIEGRDHTSGDSFILAFDDGRQIDIYVYYDREPASGSDLDLIAVARTLLPSLVAEIRSLRSNK